MNRFRFSLVAGAILAATTAMSVSTAPAIGDKPGSETPTAEYRVENVKTLEQRNAIARTGAVVDSVEHGGLNVTATKDEVRRIQALGYQVQQQDLEPSALDVTPLDFPPADSRYHNYAEMTAEINQALVDHPTLISKRVIGRSYQNREIWAVKISDNVATDLPTSQNKP